MKLAIIAAALGGIAATSAAPARRDGPIEPSLVNPNRAVCGLSEDDGREKFQFSIGAPFNDGAGCDSVRNTIVDWGGYEIEEWTCQPNPTPENTWLSFNAVSPGDVANINHIVDAVRASYPSVKFVGCGIDTRLKAREIAINVGEHLPSSKLRARAVPYNHADCDLAYGGQYEEYDLIVGRPFINGAGCKPIEKTLSDAIGYQIRLTCEDAGLDQTHLAFRAGKAGDHGDNDKIMDGLEQAYPDVDFPDECWLDTSKLKARVDQGTAICRTGRDIYHDKLNYDLLIGYPYDNGAGCPAILNTITQHAGTVDDFICDDGGNGDTHLNFYAGAALNSDDNASVLAALEEIFPSIDFNAVAGCTIEPLKVRDGSSGILENTASCSVTYDDYYSSPDATFTIEVGRPFANGAGCQPIAETFSDMIAGFDSESYDCVDNGEGDTKLSFFVGGNGNAIEDIENAMKTAYPGVTIPGPHTCWPTNGPEVTPPTLRLSMRQEAGADDPNFSKALKARDGPEPTPENTAVCIIIYKDYDSIPDATMDIKVGRPYAEGSGCQPIADTFSNMITGFQSDTYWCLDDGVGGTKLMFVVNGNYDVIQQFKDSMLVAYPEVTIPNPDVCWPTNGPPIPPPTMRLSTRQDGQLQPDTATCEHEYLGSGGSPNLPYQDFLYTVHVGRPFIDGAGCGDVEQALLDEGGFTVSEFTCNDDGYGDTLLKFKVRDPGSYAIYLNDALARVYPQMPWWTDKICH